MAIFTPSDLITFVEINPKTANDIIIKITEKIISGLLLPILKVELSFHIPKIGSRKPITGPATHTRILICVLT